MAQKKKQDPGANYRDEVRRLREAGPERLYVLCGEEEYLREQFLQEIKKNCLPGGEDDFSFHRFDGATLSLPALADAVDAVPFLTDRTLLEVRGYDTNKLAEADAKRLIALIDDLPDYCTLVFVMDAAFALDGRLKITKALQKQGRVLHFQGQDSATLVRWVARRFDAVGKRVTVPDAEYLILITGGLMNRMIPEIEKVGAYAKGEAVTRADIDAVVQKVPDAVVFEMTDLIAERRGDAVMQKLSELLSDKNNDPIALLAAVGNQMRRLYAAKCAASERLSGADLMELCGVRYDFIAQKLTQSARGFSMQQLAHAVQLCAETDFAMKRSGTDNTELLKELLLRLLAEAKA
jgi:DNA polymerase-3 subunit delta